MSYKIAIGGDHAGFQYKEKVTGWLEKAGYTFKDFGPFSDASVDYPDHVHPLAAAVEAGEFDYGILICGSGNGVAITANKHANIRAALCWAPEIVKLAREHNDANVLCLPARFVQEQVAIEMVGIFLQTAFEGGRHATRVNKIPC